jgi:hypothetical protein
MPPIFRLRLCKKFLPNGSGFEYSPEDWEAYTTHISYRALPIPTPQFAFRVPELHARAFEQKALALYQLIPDWDVLEIV